jgi:oligosaccharide repeat unit polymerase
MLQFRFNGKIMAIMQLVLLPFMIHYYIKYNSILGSLSAIDARKIKFQLGYLFANNIEASLFQTILEPLISITTLLFCIKIVQKEIKDFSFIAMSINIFLYAQIGLGRVVFFKILIYIFSMLFITRIWNSFLKEKNTKKITKILLSFFVAFLSVTFMAYITLARRGEIVSSYVDLINGYSILFNQAVIYFVGPFRAFDALLSNGVINQFGLFWGRLTFGGIDHLIGYAFNLIHINYPVSNYIIGPYTQTPITIGAGHTFNAFYTALMNYYLDFGIVGILIFPLLYGMFNSFVCNLFLKHSSATTFMLLVLTLYDSIATSFRWSYQLPETWIVLIVLAIVHGVSRSKNNSFNNLIQ